MGRFNHTHTDDCPCESRPCAYDPSYPCDNDQWEVEDDRSAYAEEIIFYLGFTVIMLLVFSLIVVFV